MACEVDGNRRWSEVEEKGLVVPCVYIFNGKQKHLDRLVSSPSQKYHRNGATSKPAFLKAATHTKDSWTLIVGRRYTPAHVHTYVHVQCRKGLIKEANIPVQELGGQRGEGLILGQYGNYNTIRECNRNRCLMLRRLAITIKVWHKNNIALASLSF